MDLNIKLESFEGPMDLLFHLIVKNKIDIYDIPIAELTDQYLEYVDAMNSSNMESMSEFLVMAATLIEIKSRILLPKPEPEEDEEGVDPREALVNRLLEYKRFKEMADTFDQRQKTAGFNYYKTADKDIISQIRRDVPKSIEDILNGADLQMLFNAFEEVLRRQEVKTDKIRSKFNSVTREVFTIEDKINHIDNLLKLHRTISFKGIFRKQSSKNEIVVTFLAMLELIKMKQIKIQQDNIFDEIIISKYEES